MDQASVTTFGKFIRIVAENGTNIISLLPSEIRGVRTGIDAEAQRVIIDTSEYTLDFNTKNRAAVIDVILATISLLAN